jgi:hypothetical protein
MAFNPIYSIRDKRGRKTLLPYQQGNSAAGVVDNPTFTFDFVGATSASMTSAGFTFTRVGTNATYIASTGLVTTAGANVPRFEYTTSGQPIGLLLEGTGKNWFLYSEDQSNAAWIEYTNLPDPRSVSRNGKSTTTAPDGSTNGNKLAIVGTGNNGLYQVLPADLKTASMGKPITVSVWAWTESGTATMAINYYNGSASSLGPTETLTTTPRRITRTITLSGVASASQNVTISNSGSSTSFVWWGYQVEDGYQASSYIKTTSAAATRDADSLTMTGTTFTTWFQHAQGTVLMSYDHKSQNDPLTTTYPRVVYFAPSASVYGTPVMSSGYAVQSSRFFVTAQQTLAGVVVDTYTGQTYTQGSDMRIGWSYSNTDGQTIVCTNGDTPVTQANIRPYSTSGIGQLNFTGSINSAIMHVKSFSYWNQAKTAANLQSICNNGNPGISPIVGNTVYLTGDIGNLMQYNYFSEGTSYSSPRGSSAEDDYATAGIATAATNFSFGMRIVVTKGAYGSMVGNIGYNINDTYLEGYDVNSPSPVSLTTGDDVAFGLFGSIFPGVVGRIEIYNWATKRTITSFEFRT